MAESDNAKAKDLADKFANKAGVLATLNAQLTEANSKLAGLRAELETARDLLATLKADANAKQAEYLRLATLKAEQDEAEVQRLAQIKAKADTIIAGGGVPTPVVNEKGEVVDYVDGKKSVSSVAPTKVVKQAGVTQVGDKTTYSRVERAKTLPNTGSQESLLGLLGAGIITSVGLGYVGKRRRG
ncbi:LPXTG cell wall anchor domain-containing protein [Streptococcus hyointestinalis]|uniref:LPXTG cell wall anchor domain-containing protein n=1 Tax=Streptococcus hyointestinalis TaxID=1337 RepID=UPI001F155376|nr:LPXTG cell wall anchor domain-containing protein [Streptococcus hyointestinalis]